MYAKHKVLGVDNVTETILKNVLRECMETRREEYRVEIALVLCHHPTISNLIKSIFIFINHN